jgi:hypothetical protein
MSNAAASALVCEDCLGDEVLKALAQTGGEIATCSFCGQENKCVPLEKVANEIHGVLQEYFDLTPTDPQGSLEELRAREGLWDRAGEPVGSAIENIAGISKEIAEAVREHLSETVAYDPKEEEAPYDSDAYYEEKGVDDWGYRESWGSYKTEIRTRSRFFSQHAQKLLDEIFDGIGQLTTASLKPVIREIAPTDANNFFYRGRVAFSEQDLKKILSSPVAELGPPPYRSARAGRMNAAGISVFYGAADEGTCVAEVRAPVGSYVVLGEFRIIRTLRVLDFDALQQIYVRGSHFDSNYHAKWRKAVFLRGLVHEISLPVMPRDEEFEYLPTQAVSEYLADRVDPRIDGIVFHSSQTAGEGRNVVLFHHASRVKPYEVPKGTSIDVDMGWHDGDDGDDSITVYENVPEEKKSPALSRPDTEGLLDWTVRDLSDLPSPEEPLIDSREPSLELQIDGIRALHIRRVKYEHAERSVSRHRYKKGERSDF